MTLRMGDAVTVANLPAGLDAYAGYVAGTWPTYSQLAAAFPGKRYLAICVQASQQGDCLDVEAGDATADQVPGWIRTHFRPVNVKIPVVYTSASNVRDVVDACTTAGIPRGAYRVWSAHYSQPHTCGPGTCGYPQADATQWTDHGGLWDESQLPDDFFDAPAAPTDTGDDMPLNDADKKWITDAINQQLRQLFAPDAECYNRVTQAATKSINQNGSAFVNWAEQGARRAATP